MASTFPKGVIFSSRHREQFRNRRHEYWLTLRLQGTTFAARAQAMYAVTSFVVLSTRMRVNLLEFQASLCEMKPPVNRSRQR